MIASVSGLLPDDDVLVRSLGDAAVVFSGRDWQTHVLPPEAIAVAEWATEYRCAHGPASIDILHARLCAEFGVAERDAGYRDLLRMLTEIGELRG